MGRNWKSKSDDEIVDFARQNYGTRGVLCIKDPGLYYTIRNRNLLYKVPRGSNRWSKEKILEECKLVFEEYNDLSYPLLRKIKKSGFENAIKRYGLSMCDIRKQFGLPVLREKERSLKKIIQYTRKIVKEKGYLPSERELIVMGEEKLSRDISDFGGYPKLRKIIGAKPPSYLHFKTRKVEEGIINRLKNTYDNIKKIEEDFKLSRPTLTSIMERAIADGRLDSSYRRNAQGHSEKQVQDAIEKLKIKNFGFERIAKETGFKSGWTIKNIMEQAIKGGKLDSKYRRLPRSTLMQEQADDALNLLKNTRHSLTKIAEKIEVSVASVKHLQDSLIKKGILDESNKRGIIKQSKIENVLLDYVN